MVRYLILAGLAVWSSAQAQEQPSFDCAKAESSAEKLVCTDADLAALDRLLAQRFAAALAVAKNLDAGAEEETRTLRAHQRGWIKGRDECWKESDLRACVEAEYLRREGQLVARYMLEEPVGTARWSCGDDAANEVVTSFFDTTLPSVRIERGDTVDTGMLVPAGSGAQYQASFGHSIWIRGETAIYTTAAPDQATFDCTIMDEGARS
ncbi:MAG: lysozyme inhibitor LprI family protein [Alphaproteobacteria bacterium]